MLAITISITIPILHQYIARNFLDTFNPFPKIPLKFRSTFLLNSDLHHPLACSSSRVSKPHFSLSKGTSHLFSSRIYCVFLPPLPPAEKPMPKT